MPAFSQTDAGPKVDASAQRAVNGETQDAPSQDALSPGDDAENGERSQQGGDDTDEIKELPDVPPEENGKLENRGPDDDARPEPRPLPSPARPVPEAAPDPDETDEAFRYFVGEVRVNDGERVLTSGARLTGESRWLEILNVGMWFEAYGHWESDTFVAEQLSILSPDSWSYYRGPAGLLSGASSVADSPLVEAWTTEGKSTLKILGPVPEDRAVRVIAFYDGETLLAVPESLGTLPTALETGWLELVGYVDGDSIIWLSTAAFP